MCNQNVLNYRIKTWPEAAEMLQLEEQGERRGEKRWEARKEEEANQRETKEGEEERKEELMPERKTLPRGNERGAM